MFDLFPMGDWNGIDEPFDLQFSVGDDQKNAIDKKEYYFM